MRVVIKVKDRTKYSNYLILLYKFLIQKNSIVISGEGERVYAYIGCFVFFIIFLYISLYAFTLLLSTKKINKEKEYK